ncbi:MAG: hypothetical protein PVH63_08975 [Balneolaceae bacterium]|jgi:hypothetical protein
MTRKLFSGVVLVCMGFMIAMNVKAQEQMSQVQLFAIHQDIVIPSKAAEYEKASRNLAQLFASNKMSTMSYTAANSEDFTYIYIMPVGDYAGLDKMEAGFNDLKMKIGDQLFMNAMDMFEGTYSSSSAYLIKYNPDLSYNPSYGSKTSDGLNFRHWDFYYVNPGMEQQAMEIAKEWKDLFQKHNIPEGYRIYVGDIGTEMPLIIVAQPARNAAEYYNNNQKNMETFGEEGQQLMKKTMFATRKMERKNGAIRPDLSYLPEQMAEAENQ